MVWVLWHHLLVTLENYINTNATFVLFGFAVTQVMVIFRALELNATNVFFFKFSKTNSYMAQNDSGQK